MQRVILAPRARRWLRNELAYLADIHPSAAHRLRERIGTARRLLSEHPRIGRPATAIGIRRLVVTPYILTHRERGEDIEISDIRHSRQAERPIPDTTQ
jgi:plasmid stabilization system protein ParE